MVAWPPHYEFRTAVGVSDEEPTGSEAIAVALRHRGRSGSDGSPWPARGDFRRLAMLTFLDWILVGTATDPPTVVCKVRAL